MAYNFDKIAKSYDRLNHIMTLGLDRRWRKLAAKEVHNSPSTIHNSPSTIHNSPFSVLRSPFSVLDVACGTGDLSIELLKRGFSVTGVDLSEEMLEIAKQKTCAFTVPRAFPRGSTVPRAFPRGFTVPRAFPRGSINFQLSNAESLPFPDASFDAVTCAFGIRNFVHLEKGLEEMTRVLKPGGRMVILELSTPDSKLIRPFYNFYTRKIIPLLGQKIAANRDAYTYLPESIERFPKGKDFLSILENPKFKIHNPRQRKLFFGVARLYICNKESS